MTDPIVPAPTEPTGPPAYFVLLRKVLDPEPAQRYLEGAGPITEAYGGEYLARGAVPTVLEGDLFGLGTDNGYAMVIVRFPSAERARSFYDSPEYRPLRDVARQAFDRQMIMIEGLPG